MVFAPLIVRMDVWACWSAAGLITSQGYVFGDGIFANAGLYSKMEYLNKECSIDESASDILPLASAGQEIL